MKVLWLCSIAPPRIAKTLGFEASNKEGWITGLYDMLLKNSQENKIQLGICFPISGEIEKLNGEVENVKYYGFHEDIKKPWKYDYNIEKELKLITEEFKPDLIHIFGTEYPHTLAMANVYPFPERILVGIQGLCNEYAKYYMAEIPKNVQRRVLLRDFLKHDNLIQQQRKFVSRGVNEVAALNKITHVTGRTDFDKNYTKLYNPKSVYHFMNETLRSNFYDKRWKYGQCEPYTIFVSQGNYPIKGLHFMVEAMKTIIEKYPAAHLYVAGDVVTRYKTLKDKIKISSYGKYLLDLIKTNSLETSITFVGNLNNLEICQRYLSSNVFVSPSAIENSPNSVGEAMLLGVPVISSDVGGVHNLISDRTEGYLYPYTDVNQLAESVCKIFADPASATILGNKARAHAMVTHDANVNYHRLLDIYRRIND